MSDDAGADITSWVAGLVSRVGGSRFGRTWRAPLGLGLLALALVALLVFAGRPLLTARTPEETPRAEPSPLAASGGGETPSPTGDSTAVPQPSGQPTRIPDTAGAPAARANHAIPSLAISAQGFDTCEAPSLATLANWIVSSPYRVVNLYIGGSARSCPNTRLTADYVAAASAQGWRFIPTWVGPQAPCLTSRRSRLSLDPAAAYVEGVREADLASDRLASLGFPAGSIVYYDVEAYDTANQSCRTAVRSFIAGWSARLHDRSSPAGVYGAGCGSALSDFLGSAAEPDYIWLAWRTLPAYTPEVPVFGNTCVADDLWSNHQRIRQYAADHNETWGGLTLRIDSNVVDGPVADLCGPGASSPCSDGPPSLVDPAEGARATVGRAVTFEWTAVSGHAAYRFEAWNESVAGKARAADVTGLDYSFAPDSPGDWRWQVRAIKGDASLGPVAASRALRVDPAPVDWQVEYFGDSSLTAPCHSEALTSTHLFVEWPSGGPGGGCPADGFSARLTRRVTFEAASYAFTLVADDRGRLKLDGETLLDLWPTAASTATPTPASITATKTQVLTAGEHLVVVEFADLSGPARLAAYWSGPGSDLPSEARSPGQWLAEYWPNLSLWGEPVVRKVEGSGPLVKDWGADGPGWGLPADRFSARFERTVYFPCGTYRFKLRHNNGARLLIDGAAVGALDHWTTVSPDAPREYSADVKLATGSHTLRVAYYESAGEAELSLGWTLVSACPCVTEPISPSAGQTEVPLSQTLSWAGGDLEGEVVTYSVYLDPAPEGLSAPVTPTTLVCAGAATACDPLAGRAAEGAEPSLLLGTRYYWQAVATDAKGNSSRSAIFDFVTASTRAQGE